jgi:hypothetical protein
LRLYNLFEKMNHMFIADLHRQQHIDELIDMVNTNSPYIIPKEAIEVIYEFRVR